MSTIYFRKNICLSFCLFLKHLEKDWATKNRFLPAPEKKSHQTVALQLRRLGVLPFPLTETSLIHFPVILCLLLPHLLPGVFWHNVFNIHWRNLLILLFTTWNVRTRPRELLNMKPEAHDESSVSHLLSPEAIHCKCPTVTTLLIKLS